MYGFVVTYPGCIMDEVQPAIAKLQNTTILKIIDLKSLAIDGPVDFIIIPGGSCDEALDNFTLHDLIRKTNESGKVVAGICNGAVVLASAGILKNQKCTHTAHPKYAPMPEFEELLAFADKVFEGSKYIDEDVVIDGKIITAKPQVSVEFAEAIALKLGIHPLFLDSPQFVFAGT
jgi:putative intracellular protease/amidase